MFALWIPPGAQKSLAASDRQSQSRIAGRLAVQGQQPQQQPGFPVQHTPGIGRRPPAIVLPGEALGQPCGSFGQPWLIQQMGRQTQCVDAPAGVRRRVVVPGQPGQGETPPALLAGRLVQPGQKEGNPRPPGVEVLSYQPVLAQPGAGPILRRNPADAARFQSNPACCQRFSQLSGCFQKRSRGRRQPG